MLNKEIEEVICLWYKKNKRDLPWRNTNNPYFIWVSEIMLQQTRIEAVIPYFERFLKNLPTIEDLANASETTLLKLWQGLGYYNRVKNMKEAAIEIVKRRKFPSTYEELLTLKGIGSYTAAAIASFAFHQKVACVDGNVMRVFARYYGFFQNVLINKSKVFIQKELQTLPLKESALFNQGIMELGETICLPSSPICEKCPLKEKCFARTHQKIDQLPLRLKKIEKKIVLKTMVVYECHHKIALRKRNKGVLSGTYEPIEVKVIPPSAPFIGHFKHVFSHMIWEMDVYHVILNEEFKESDIIFVSKEDIKEKYPIGTAYDKWLKHFL